MEININSNEHINNFNPLIIKNLEGYCVYLPGWKIFGIGSTLEIAYSEYENNLKQVIKNIDTYDIKDDIFYKLNPKEGSYQKIFSEILIFNLKILSSSIILVLTIILLLPNISAAIKNSFKEIIHKDVISSEFRDLKYWAVVFPDQINRKIDSLSTEDERQMKKNWNKLLDRTLQNVKEESCKN
jgi:hypothetical protein